MSGCFISAMQQSVDQSVANPLECQLCHTELVGPIRLPCQHYFCRRCITATQCPLCGTTTADGELSEDSVLSYLIESSHERTEICANCDRTVQPMFFCETCQQPLCEQCWVLTHKAKIFALHHIAPLEERGRLRSRLVCKTHKEPFIVFCQELKKLMCIECFNAASSVKRGNFLNIDLAHKICCDKLEKASARLRFFHDDVVEQIELCRRFAAEIEINFNANTRELNASFEELSQLIDRFKSTLLERLTNDRVQKQKIISDELRYLENLKDPIRVNLLSASIFCSYASKIDLLHYFSSISKAMEQIMTKRTKKLSLSADYRIDVRTELAGELARNFFYTSTGALIEKTRLDGDPNDGELLEPVSHIFGDGSSRFDANFVVGGEGDLPPGGEAFVDGTTNVLRFSADPTAAFNEEIQRINTATIGSFEDVSRLSKELVQMQRDITLRRCLVAADNFNRLSTACEMLKNNLSGQRLFAHSLQPIFQELWRQQAQRIRHQQLLYRRKVDELGCLHRFAERVFESAEQLRPFAVYIASVVGVMDGRRTLEVHVSPMEQICRQISSLKPDSHQRIDAIEREEESRRLSKMQQESLAHLPEAQQAKRRLKETKAPSTNKILHHQAVVIVEDRGRSSFMPSAKKSKDKSKREYRADGVASCVSPIFSSSPAVASELEIRCASSLATFSTTHSNVFLSPATSVAGDGGEVNDVKSIVDDMDSLLDMEIRSQNIYLVGGTGIKADVNRKKECLAVEEKFDKIQDSQEDVSTEEDNIKEPTKTFENKTEKARSIGKLNQLSPQIKSIAHLIEGQLRTSGESAALELHIAGESPGKAIDETDSGQAKEKSTAVVVALPKCVQPPASAISVSEATIEARSRLLQSIKEHMNCVQCASDLTKYTCPKCEVKTCSLICSKQHKVDRDCDGVRSMVPKFVPILGYSAFSERLSVEDQHFMSAIHHRAHARSSLRSLKRSRPGQPQSEAYQRLAAADGGEPAATDFENDTGTGCPPTKKVAASDAEATTVADDSVAESEEVGASGELSGSHVQQSVLASARKRRIWLNLDDAGKDCGKTRYDKFSETMLWTVGVRFLYTKPASLAGDEVFGEEPTVTESTVGEAAAVEDGQIVKDTTILSNVEAVDAEASKDMANEKTDGEKEKLAIQEESELMQTNEFTPTDSTAALIIEGPTKTSANGRTEEEEQLYTVHNIPESLSVFTLVRQFVRPREHGPLVSRADLDMVKMAPFVEAAERENGLMIYMRVPYFDEERYYVVDPTNKLIDNLRNRFVDGYPTLIVTISDQYNNFRVLSELEARTIFDRLRPSMDNREPAQRQYYSHGHVNNNRRFIYNDNNRYHNNNNNNYGRNGFRPFHNNNNNGRRPPRNFNNSNGDRQGYNNYRHNNNRGFANRQRGPAGDNLERYLNDPRFNC